jgi:hypothetical protein
MLQRGQAIESDYKVSDRLFHALKIEQYLKPPLAG